MSNTRDPNSASSNRSRNPNLWLSVVAGLSVLGFGSALYLTQLYYNLRSGSGSFKSICNINSAINCSAVAASRYAELFPGFPVSCLAAGVFLALLITVLIGRNAFWRRECIRFGILLSGLSSIYAVFLIIIMATALHAFCLFCLMMDVACMGSLLILLGQRNPHGAQTVERGQWKTLIGTALACIFVLAIVCKTWDSNDTPSAVVHDMVESVMATSPIAVNSGSEFSSVGPADAPITIVEFSDFQCPFCKVGALMMDSVMHRFPGQVRIVFRNFPMDQGCNPIVEHSMHQFACEAARAGICANKQGKFEAYYQNVFENQESLATGKPAEFAQSVGAEVIPLTNCMSLPDTQAILRKDVEEGKQLGVNATPTFFINGRKVEGVYPLAAWSQIIERLLSTNHASR